MPIPLIVLMSCLLTSINSIFLKKGMRTGNPTTAMLFSLSITWVLLGGLSLIFARNTEVTEAGILIYLLIGSFAPLVVRYFTYKGINLLGASRSTPIRSFTPIFAYFIAVLFLKEDFNPPVFAGTILIIIGAFTLSKKKKNKPDLDSKINSRHYLYPFIAAVLSGAAANLRKYGFNFLESPILAAFFTASSALFLFTISLFIFKKMHLIQINKNSIKYFGLASSGTAITVLLTLFSLKHAKVTLVAPLFATIPLFTLILSILFLKKEEKITSKIIVGTLIMFAGVQLVLYYI